MKRFLFSGETFFLYLEKIALVSLFVLVCAFIGIQMVGRISKSGIYVGWMKEASQYTLVLFAFIGAALATHTGSHVKVSFFVNRVPLRWQKYLLFFAKGCFCCYCISLGWVSVKFIVFLFNTGQVTSNLPIDLPLGYIYLIFPFTFFAMAIHVLAGGNKQ